MDRNRKQWGKGSPALNVPAAGEERPKEEVTEKHDEYLILLQERNRLMKRLKKKDPRQMEIERKEQGFSLYVNGANTESDVLMARKATCKPSANGPKTMKKGAITHRDLIKAQQEHYEKTRSKTAPVKTQRKNWLASSVQVKTNDGNRVKIKAPGNYSEDFEPYVSESYQDDGSDSEEEDSDEERAQVYRKMTRVLEGDLSVDSLEVDASRHVRGSTRSDQLMLSLDDVKKLRRSLVMNASIQQSIAEEVEGGESSDSDAASPIPEEDEDDIEEEIQESLDIEMKGNKHGAWKPGDMIVLEFAPKPKNVGKNLSVARKSNSEVYEPLRGNQQKYPSTANPTKSKDIILQAEPSNKKSSRPLSANRKSTKDMTMDSTADVSGVLAAMRAENEKIEKEKLAEKKEPRPKQKSSHGKPNSPRVLTPLRSSCDRPPSSTSVIPEPHSKSFSAGIGTGSSDTVLTENNLATVLDRVLEMDSKQQKKLLRVLSKIEAASNISLKSVEKGPMRAVHGLPTRPDIKAMKQSQSDDVEMIEVHMEVVSNWGHPSRVGLTEIQFFDMENKRLEVDPNDVNIYGADDVKGIIANVLNGKFKTTKERNMWSCSQGGDKAVELSFVLHRPSTATQAFGISKIKIWNYNKSLNDLGIGMKDVRIFIGGELVYQGEIDKGCGNQVFDYNKSVVIHNVDAQGDSTPRSNPSPDARRTPSPKTITRSPTGTPTSYIPGSFNPKFMQKSPRTSPEHPRKSTNEKLRRSSPPRKSENIRRSAEKSNALSPRISHERLKSPRKSADDSKDKHTRSTTRCIDRSPDPGIQRPVIATSPDGESEEIKARVTGEGKRAGTPGKSSRMAANFGAMEPDKANTVQDLKSPRMSQEKIVPTVAASMDDVSLLQQLKQVNEPSRSNSRAKSRPKSETPRWLQKEEEEPFPRPDSGKNETLLEMGHWPNRGLPELPTVLDDSKQDLPQSRTPTTGRRSSARTVKTPDLVADDSEEQKFFQEHRAQLEADTSRCDSPMTRIETARQKWRKQHSLSLEESWTSLNLFDKNQRGRISIDMQGDALDSYLPADVKKERKELPIVEDLENSSSEDDEFIIPELPYGKELVIDIRSTWGDNHYVGLTGIEVFTKDGEPATVAKISADPEDINVLPEYDKDPRVVTNLIDGINRTRDDTHMWLAPYNKGKKHSVFITFEKPCRVAMMRIWNYNKSRIHSYRGVKDVYISLDGKFIFKGEITRACGGVIGGTEAFGDTILFSTDEEILDAVSQYDEQFEGDEFSDSSEEEEEERPTTADDGEGVRPFTSAVRKVKNQEPFKPEVGEFTDIPDVEPPMASPRREQLVQTAQHVSQEGDALVYEGQYVQLNFTATWGDIHYLGLTGLEVVGRDGEALPLDMKMIEADPRDLSVLPGYDRDDRTLDKVIDGVNVTLSDEHMWLVPFTEGEDHTLTITFRQSVEMTGLRLWNYNKSPEDTYRGAKVVHVTLDGKLLSPADGYLIRKGPGNCYFDFAQEISFSPQTQTQNVPYQIQPTVSGKNVALELASQDYESVQMPCGFIYQFHLVSTHGDPYYVGLNGVEFFDGQGNKIELTENHISAYPDSVNVLDGITNDIRTPDKLIDGFNDTPDGTHMWLAPVLPSIMNRVYVIFDQPMTISMIKLWNYSKTASRGVKDFGLYVDDLLVYNGTLDPVQPVARGILPTINAPQPYHTIVFTNDKAILQKERHTIISNRPVDQDVQLTNDKTVMTHYSNPKSQTKKNVDQALRPKTSVPAKKR
ncbi:katanin-interacting protein-like isoform X2 [Lineus longissimus]|uniref:katanin-interacting protein-like isoform X2 n=1 Tax=Lineus longissimus TaxID=88925 RepID=UPI00315C9A0D